MQSSPQAIESRRVDNGTFLQGGVEDEGYGDTATRMVELAKEQPGFLGIESAREEVGITVSYWADLAAIKSWKANMEHLAAQKLGREKWYAAFKLRIAKVERDYGMHI